MKIKVLIVEDCSVMRAIIRRTLRLSNLTADSVYEAGNGFAGLKILEEEEVDLIILDMNMPHMDGMEMLDVIKSKPQTRNIPILIVSAESNKVRVESLIRLVSGFLHKPFTPEALKAEIIKVVPGQK